MLEALQLRAIATGQKETAAEDRQRLVGEATSLLAPDPRYVAHGPDKRPDGPPTEPDGRDSTSPPGPAPSAFPAPARRAGPQDTAAPLLPLQRFAQLTGLDPSAPAVSPDASPRPASDPLYEPPARPVHAPNRRAPPRPIPEMLEGVPVVRRDADALERLTILASLRYVDEGDGPYLVAGLRLDAGAPRVQLASRPGATPTPVVTGWLEVGDAPAPGWRVIRIDATLVDLLTPSGNPLRVRWAGGQSSVDSRAARSRTTSRMR
jgi:hypothetical protein